MDFIIIIILSLLVAFIIGFNIVQIVDNKLSAVTINVPPNNAYNLPPIYLNIDKDSNIKQVKINDVIRIPNESDYYESFQNINNDDNQNKEITENFGDLADYPDNFNPPVNAVIADIVSDKLGYDIINQDSKYETAKNPNYNTVNNIPLLITPDTDTPNRSTSTYSYYKNRVKLVDNPNSSLVKLQINNLNNIDKVVSKCALKDSSTPPVINGTFDGYNSLVDLRTDSYANVTSIGKSMLTPYVSFPVAS